MKEKRSFVDFIYFTMIDLNRVCKKEEAYYCAFEWTLSSEIIITNNNNYVF